MNEKHFKLINEILNLPVISDMDSVEFEIKYKGNGKVSWELFYRYISPIDEKIIRKFNPGYLETEDELDFLLQSLLSELKTKEIPSRKR